MGAILPGGAGLIVRLGLALTLTLMLTPALISQAPAQTGPPPPPPATTPPAPPTPPPPPATAAGGMVREALPGYSISTSRQFVIYAEQSAERMAFASSAEELKGQLRTLFHLDKDEEWHLEIVIELHEGLPEPDQTRFAASTVTPLNDGTFRMQLDVQLGPGFTREAFDRELMRLLLLEMMLGGREWKPGEIKGTRLLPAWLHEGIAELVRYRTKGTPNELFAGLLGSRKLLDVRQILEGDPVTMDSVSRVIFQASSAAFVKALFAQDSGALRLITTMKELPRYEGDVRPLLLEFYPALSASASSLEKWWALEVASMAQPDALDFLSPAETRRRLAAALTIRIDGGEVVAAPAAGAPVAMTTREVPLIELETLEAAGDLRRLLRPSQLALTRLSILAFPLYRSLVAEYRGEIDRLAAGKKFGAAKRLRKLDETRAGLDTMLEAMGDYLNWYEAARVTGRSGAFEAYRDTVSRLRAEREMGRTDDLSRYLDAMESKYGGGAIPGFRRAGR